MANWKTTVEIGDLHAAHQGGTLTAADLGKNVAERLARNIYAHNVEMRPIIAAFKKVRSVSGYDKALKRLYDFGDWEHRIWIDTFRRG